MRYRKSKTGNFLKDMTRKQLEHYVSECSRLVKQAKESKNEHNFKLFNLWLNSAVFELERRDRARAAIIKHLNGRGEI